MQLSNAIRQVIESQIKMSYKLYYDNSGPVPPKITMNFRGYGGRKLADITLFCVEDPADTWNCMSIALTSCAPGTATVVVFFENARDGENSCIIADRLPATALALGSLVYSIGNSEKVRYRDWNKFSRLQERRDR
jgi:hypothetical protein